MNELVERVKQIAAEILNMKPTQISLNSSPENIENWDSLQHLNIVLALEQEYNINFTPEEISEMLNIELIVQRLKEKITPR